MFQKMLQGGSGGSSGLNGEYIFGTATAKDYISSEGSSPDKAFQTTPQVTNYDCWSTSTGGTSVETWIQIEYNSPLIFDKVGLMPRLGFPYAYPKNFDIMGYDGTSWTNLGNFTTTKPTDTTIQPFEFTNNKAFSIYKLLIHGCWQDRTSIGRILFTKR